MKDSAYFKGTRDKILAAVASKTFWKKRELNISSEARGKIMAAVAGKATSSHDRSGTYSMCKEEEDRIEYTLIIPSRPWKKKRKIKKRRIEQSTLSLFHADP